MKLNGSTRFSILLSENTSIFAPCFQAIQSLPFSAHFCSIDELSGGNGDKSRYKLAILTAASKSEHSLTGFTKLKILYWLKSLEIFLEASSLYYYRELLIEHFAPLEKFAEFFLVR